MSHYSDGSCTVKVIVMCVPGSCLEGVVLSEDYLLYSACVSHH